MADVKILTISGKSSRLGTLVRLAHALGYDLDDVFVKVEYSDTTLVRPEGQPAPERPRVIVRAPSPVIFDLGLLGDDDGAPLTPSTETATLAPPEPAPAAVVQCTHCDRTFENVQRMKQHRTRTHGGGDSFGDTGHSGPKITLACQARECDFTTSRADDLNNHTVSAHGRRATSAERTPVSPPHSDEADPAEADYIGRSDGAPA